MSSELAEVIGGNKQTAGVNSKSLKIIAEVDGKISFDQCLFVHWINKKFLFHLETNIEEVLNLPNLSQVPKAFLTEIQQDQAYGTIFQALKSKVPHRLSSSSPVARNENFEENNNNDEDDDDDDDTSENRALSPDLMATDKQNDDGDDQFSMDDIASTVSSMNMLSNNNDGYDTDIESGLNQFYRRASIHPWSDGFSSRHFQKKRWSKNLTSVENWSTKNFVDSRKQFLVHILWRISKIENWFCVIINSATTISKQFLELFQ